MKSLALLSVARCAALAASSLIACAAQAQVQPGPYAQFSIGRSDYEEDCSGVQNCDTNGTAWLVQGGFRFGSGLAAEGLLLNLGESSGSSGGISVTVKADAIGAGGAFHLPFTRELTGVARLGLASVKVRGTGRLGNFSASLSDRSTNLYAGIALNWTFTRNLYAEAGFLATRGELEGDKGDLSALTVGVGWRF